MDRSLNILILGGTRDAINLAIALDKSDNLDVVSSLAGRTLEPDLSFGKTRIGGFGGAEGLVAYIDENNVDILIDATHPFATTISRNVRKAAMLSGAKRFILARAKWVPHEHDEWWECEDLKSAADIIPQNARAFLAMGHQHIAQFSHREDVFFIARMIDPPKSALPLAQYDVVVGMPSDITAVEKALFEKHAITHLICRNSGGTKAYAKIAAAREMNIPVIIVARPPRIDGQAFASVHALNTHILKLIS